MARPTDARRPQAPRPQNVDQLRGPPKSTAAYLRTAMHRRSLCIIAGIARIGAVTGRTTCSTGRAPQKPAAGRRSPNHTKGASPTAPGRGRRPLPLRPPPPPYTRALRSPVARSIDCCPAAQTPFSPRRRSWQLRPAHADQGFCRYSGRRRPHRVLTPGVKSRLQRLRLANGWRGPMRIAVTMVGQSADMLRTTHPAVRQAVHCRAAKTWFVPVCSAISHPPYAWPDVGHAASSHPHARKPLPDLAKWRGRSSCFLCAERSAQTTA